MLAVLFGTAQNIMSKSSKYSLFDPTKEMAYIPSTKSLRLKERQLSTSSALALVNLVDSYQASDHRLFGSLRRSLRTCVIRNL